MTDRAAQPATTPYDEDVAYIHAAGYGGHAAGATPAVIARLKDCGIGPGATVGDVGCGAGVSTRLLCEAGYHVWAQDASPAFTEMAARAAPSARMLASGPVYTAELPPAEAVLILGEALNYHPPLPQDRPRDWADRADDAVRALFRRLAALLPAGGLLAFDIIVAGPEPLDGHGWETGPDWAVLVDRREERAAGRLTRTIESFRAIESCGAQCATYRRNREEHTVRVFDAATVRRWLEDAGFAVVTAPAYGDHPLLPRRLAFEAVRHG